MNKIEELTVFMSNSEGVCGDCGQEVLKKDMVTLKRPEGVLCLACSDLEHLVYLPAGQTALTRRARKYSPLSAVVMQFSKSRRRNERQGVLVSAEGLVLAENECLSDENRRAKQRERDRVRRELLDVKYVAEFASEIRKLFPGCPEGIATEIAAHACEKYSGRVGRSANAKLLDKSYVTLAVRAHIRHVETNYDSLYGKGYSKEMAREEVLVQVDKHLSGWASA